MTDLTRYSAIAAITAALAVYSTAAAAPQSRSRAARRAAAARAAEASMAAAEAGREWHAYGHDAGGMRYSPLDQINLSNVKGLTRAWTYHTGEVPTGGREPSPFEATPLMVDDVLYFTTPSGRVIAIDAETGAERWTYDPHVNHGAAPRHRGVAYWQDASGGDRRIFVGTEDGRLIGLDARNGTPAAGFGDNGTVTLRPTGAGEKQEYSIRSPAAVYKDLVIVGATVPEYPARGPAGDVRAFDPRTGRLVWTFKTVPPPGADGHDTWEGDSWRDRTGANVWSVMSVDEARGLVYLPVGSPAYDFYGGDRKGANLFGNSLVALDATTGRRVWHFQAVHHDLWDYDLPAQPVLLSVEREGRTRDAVAQLSKMGFVFLLDRATGEPLFPIEERPVPPSTIPGESAWPTQPFPTAPPPLSRTTAIGRNALTRVTPKSQKFCEALFDSLTSGGIFTPAGTKLTLIWPGSLGGSNWSGASYSPKIGYLFVNVNEVGAVGQMHEEPAGAPLPWRRFSDLDRGEYARFWDEDRLPCQQPPWGTLAAVDLAKGTIAWQVPLGIVPSLEAQGIKGTGTLSLGGTIATAGGLVFIGGTNDSRFRAFDARTGAEVWTATLEASAHATPITYRGARTGKQFVVVAAGGGGYLSSKTADTLVAFALP
jgi:quinoprotein glucose dehydrogenase